MKMDRCRHPLGWLLVPLFAWLPVVLTAGAPRLEIPSVSPSGIALRLSGDAGKNYRIEASTNLISWVSVATGVATTGTLAVQLPAPESPRWRYYRGLLLEDAKPLPTVTPTVRSNLITQVMVLPEVGAVARLETPDGTAFSFSIGTNAVFEPMILTLIAITNLGGVPAGQGFLTAVRMEPEGLILAAPFFLQIDFPTNIPARQVSSYAFKNQGADWHLVPDVVVTNRVRILVDQLRSYGCGVFTLDELHAAGGVAPGVSPARAHRPSLHATMEECYPEDEAEARQMREEIEAKLQPQRVKVAEILGEERQKQLVGIEDDGEGESALARVFSESEQFVRDELESRITQASQKCATARELIPYLLGFERQRQLLGVASDSEPTNPSYLSLLCDGMRRCQEQAIECCRTRGGDTRLISFLLGIERQRQLLGIPDGQCGASLDIPGVVDACAPKWFGTLKITEVGSFSTNRNNSQFTSSTTETWNYELETTVASVEESIQEPILFIPGHTNLTFHFVGHVLGSHSLTESYEDKWDPCSGGSEKALASAVPRPRPRPHDGGDALKVHSSVGCKTNAPVEFEVRARVMAPGTGALGITPYLQIITPSYTVFETGWTTWVMKTVTSNGCDVEDRSGPPNGQQFFGGHNYYRETGGFQSTGDSVRFTRITPKSKGNMVVLERVELNVRRIK